MPRGVDAEPRPLRRDKIDLTQQPFRVLFAAAVYQTPGRQLRGPDTGERAPGRRGRQHLQSRQIIAALQNPPRRAHIGFFKQDAVRCEAGLPLICDLCRGCQIAPAPREGRDGPVAGKGPGAELTRLLRKKLKLELFDRIALGMVFQI